MCFHYDDTVEFAKVKQVTCRKPHKCNGCKREISIGEIARHSSGKFDGEFFNYYDCENCQRLIYSIAVYEINRGCRWENSWCSSDDLQEYWSNKNEEIQILSGTLEECYEQVNRLWGEKCLESTQNH